MGQTVITEISHEFNPFGIIALFQSTLSENERCPHPPSVSQELMGAVNSQPFANAFKNCLIVTDATFAWGDISKRLDTITVRIHYREEGFTTVIVNAIEKKMKTVLPFHEIDFGANEFLKLFDIPDVGKWKIGRTSP